MGDHVNWKEMLRTSSIIATESKSWFEIEEIKSNKMRFKNVIKACRINFQERLPKQKWQNVTKLRGYWNELLNTWYGSKMKSKRLSTGRQSWKKVDTELWPSRKEAKKCEGRTRACSVSSLELDDIEGQLDDIQSFRASSPAKWRNGFVSKHVQKQPKRKLRTAFRYLQSQLTGRISD